MDGCYENWPVTTRYIREHIGRRWKPEFDGKPTNFQEAALSLMPRIIYEKFVKGYTEKQWGVSADSLPPDGSRVSFLGKGPVSFLRIEDRQYPTSENAKSR